MNKKPMYKETQSMNWFILLLIFLWGLIFYTFWFDVGDRNTSPSSLIPTAVVFFILKLLFYNLKISIFEDEIKATFGIGLIKRSMKIDEIDFSSIETIKVPWYYGIGLRITPKGTLYNSRFGSALRMKSKDGKKVFFVGTKNAELITDVLRKLN